MTNGYVKLFSTILASSIWSEDDRTRLVWITMLVLMDSEGQVKGSVPGLAHFARVPVEDCRMALAKFMEPDPETVTQEHDGRRIEAIEGGWRILNAGKYREMMSLDQRREYWRKKKQESRDKFSKATKGMTIKEVVRQKQRIEADFE